MRCCLLLGLPLCNVLLALPALLILSCLACSACLACLACFDVAFGLLWVLVPMFAFRTRTFDAVCCWALFPPYMEKAPPSADAGEFFGFFRSRKQESQKWHGGGQMKSWKDTKRHNETINMWLYNMLWKCTQPIRKCMFKN